MIFPLIWRILPGPAALRALELLVLLALIVYVLFTWVFPWIAADILPPPDSTVDAHPTPRA